MTDGKPPPKAPRDLAKSGRALWRAVVAEFDLDEHERALLHEAARTRDLCDGLQAQLDTDGLMSESSQGARVHPAAVELRQQRIVLARLLAALKVPSGEDETAPNRAPRGVHVVRGA